MTTLHRQVRNINYHDTVEAYADEVYSVVADIGVRVTQSDLDFIEEIRNSKQDDDYRYRMLTNVLIEVGGRLRRKEILSNGIDHKPWSGILEDMLSGKLIIRYLSE